MRLLDNLLTILVPHNCLGCESEGRLLCNDCISSLKPALDYCYQCRISTFASQTCNRCLATSFVDQVQALTVYEGLAKNLVWKLKFGSAQSAAAEIANLMEARVSGARRDNLFIVPVPTATTRIRQRGYDQACLIAREVARRMHRPCVRALVRQTQTHQVGASRQQRVMQLAGAFRLTVSSNSIRGAEVLLIDDVVTTGATLTAAAQCLHEAGASRITALVFAQTKTPAVLKSV